MKKLLSLFLALTMCLALASCGDDPETATTDTPPSNVSDSSVPDQASVPAGTRDNPADLSEVQRIETDDGVFTCKMSHVYLGNDATNLLVTMGEEESELIDDDTRLVVLEYNLSAEEGFDESTFAPIDYFSSNMWSTDYKTRYRYYMYELYENASKDISFAEFHVGESGTVYQILELPKNVTEYITGLGPTVDGDYYWVWCKLE